MSVTDAYDKEAEEMTSMAMSDANGSTRLHRSGRARTGMLALLIAGFTLTACAGGDADLSAATEEGDSNPGAGTQPDGDADTDADTDAEPDEADSALTPDASPAECLVGAWLADNEGFIELIAPTMDAHQAIVDADGTVVMTFTADGQTSTEYSDWSFTVTQDGTEVTLVRQGVDRGTYSVDSETQLTVTETASESTAEMFIGDASYGAQPRPEGAVLSSGEFTCTPQLLTVVADGIATEFTRR